LKVELDDFGDAKITQGFSGPSSIGIATRCLR
jgi:hypothetical protein